ncbi:enoyl-CoA hydratase/isomerase [Pseudomassariella vexata]|uniref:Enoyl-CoA hydratase/isomerase n=1 Tax=Pseudomassariella vexata TaxID=1141098 RepID=A0A1Y2EAQ0_9PEZI|nr:enoyl-CoA hydratase/isomerase [Pseudomassariella vexata]ORY68612.1 enoyl-CoA hydratase/isomerase [Pseudomassariella vexata]
MTTSPQHPVSYNDLSLPQLKLFHHPASSPIPTPTILVILNRPDHNNAFTDTMAMSLVTAFGLLSKDPRVKAIVFTSGDERNRVFCPGMDLASSVSSATKGGGNAEENDLTSAELAKQRNAHRDGGAQVSLAIYHCTKPVIAALNGHAVGVGITMTLPCNLRIASSSAKIGFVFARRGLAMEACSSFFLPRILGTGRALELVSTGRAYLATDIAVRDLFAEVVEPGKVVERALEVAEEMGRLTSGVSTTVMRDMIYRGPKNPEEAFELESKILFDLFRGRDAREGMRSFLEKREPGFTGQFDVDKPLVWPWWEGATDRGGVMAWLKSKI